MGSNSLMSKVMLLTTILHGSLDQFPVLEAGEDQHLDAGIALPDRLRHLKAGHAGHHYVHQDHLGAGLLAQEGRTVKNA